MQDDFGLSCPCGSENFERVVVHRPGHADYMTEFVACVLCKVMFHLPEVKQLDAEFNYDKAFPPGTRRGAGEPCCDHWRMSEASRLGAWTPWPGEAR
jgi:hypothetical protein